MGLVVKNVQLPSYEMSVNELNQYNRKRLVQTKINYQPVEITFHDDGSDLIRNMWYSYYSYYYKDPTQTGNNGKYLKTDGSSVSWSSLPTYMPVLQHNGSTVTDVSLGNGYLPVLNHDGVTTTNVVIS